MKLKLGLITLILILANISFVLAEFDLDIEAKDKGSVIISELNNPAIFEFIVTNNGNGDFAEVYTLVGVAMSPKGTFEIPNGKSIIKVMAYPGKEIRNREGFYSFEYQIRGQTRGIFKGKLNIKVVSFKEALSFEYRNIHPDDNKIEINIKNNVNSYLNNINVNFASAFFDFSQDISLEPFENKKIEFQIDEKKISRLVAGPYIANAIVKVADISIRFEGVVNYLEKEGTSVVKESSGFLVRKTTVTKVNEGSVPVNAIIEIRKDIISRLFTSYSLEPIKSERQGAIVKYEWERKIDPGEDFSVTATTNYTFPFILIILVIIIAFLVRIYTLTTLVLRKKVSFVKTKGGEFALKVNLFIRARKDVRNIQLIDRIPHMAKLYEQFGRKPDKIDEQTRRLIWDISHLNKGEERVYSYIFYSKVRTVGRFELPSAIVLFEQDGEKREVWSNKTYFVSELTVE